MAELLASLGLDDSSSSAISAASVDGTRSATLKGILGDLRSDGQLEFADEDDGTRSATLGILGDLDSGSKLRGEFAEADDGTRSATLKAIPRELNEGFQLHGEFADEADRAERRLREEHSDEASAAASSVALSSADSASARSVPSFGPLWLEVSLLERLKLLPVPEASAGGPEGWVHRHLLARHVWDLCAEHEDLLRIADQQARPAMRGVGSLVVPIFAEPRAFGPQPAQDVAFSLVVMTLICSAAGYWLTRSQPLLLTRLLLRLKPDLQLRDEVWEEALLAKEKEEDPPDLGQAEQGAPRARNRRKRSGAELLFIVVHNAAVAAMAALSWALGWPDLALHAFCLEVAYEIFDSFSLGFQRMEPETLIHHLVSPICILCSTQTDVDFRVLCQLCICIDASGAILGLSKFLLRFSHLSAQKIYQFLSIIYVFLRVIFPLIDTAIIVTRELMTKGGIISRMHFQADSSGYFDRTDWTQLYFWAVAVLNAFNVYFYLVIRARARLPAHVVASYELSQTCS
ncbi:unnamed protein product [Effrenium voratum]|nr:unnamed protein product [Effrenium voratum]